MVLGNFQSKILIIFTIFKSLRGENISIYGDGQNIRDWLHVEDHINALLSVLNKGILEKHIVSKDMVKS